MTMSMTVVRTLAVRAWSAVLCSDVRHQSLSCDTHALYLESYHEVGCCALYFVMRTTNTTAVDPLVQKSFKDKVLQQQDSKADSAGRKGLTVESGALALDTHPPLLGDGLVYDTNDWFTIA